MNGLLLYTGGAVVRGFGSITRENRLILMMEWIAEAILLVFTGVLVVLTTVRFGADGAAPETTFTASAVMLFSLAAVSAATGGRVDFIMCRVCAPIFTLSAALILTGALL